MSNKLSIEAENPALNKGAVICLFKIGDKIKLVSKKLFYFFNAKKGQYFVTYHFFVDIFNG